MLDSWSRKQKRLFSEYFKVKEGYSLTEAREELQGAREVWLKLYEVLAKSGLQLSEYSRIEKVRLLIEETGIYLVITIFHNRHILIDCRDVVSLGEDKLVNAIKPSTLLDLIGKHEFSFETVPDEIAKEFVDLYVENKAVYDNGPCLSYKVSKGKNASYLSMDFVSQELGLSFVSKDKVNYMYFISDRLDGMSGDCDRKTAAEIGEKTKEILIPKTIVDKYSMYCPPSVTKRKTL